jgi:hypothetical protein
MPQTLTTDKGVVFADTIAAVGQISPNFSGNPGILVIELKHSYASGQEHAELPNAFIDSSALVRAVPEFV